MANRVPLIVDTSTLFIKELPLGDGLDLTGCNLVGVTSFTRSDGFEFSGITTFSSGVVFNDGYTANTAKISDLGENRVLLCTSADGEVGDSANLTFDGSTLGITGAATVSTNLTVTGNAAVNGNTDLGNATSDTITATGRFDSALVPSDDDTYDLGASDKEWKDLYVDGVGNIDSLAVGVLTHTGLNQNRVLLVTDSDGTIGDNAGLSYDGSTLAVTGDITASGNLNYQTVTDIRSVGVVTASSNLQVGAGISVVGVSTYTGTQAGLAHTCLKLKNLGTTDGSAVRITHVMKDDGAGNLKDVGYINMTADDTNQGGEDSSIDFWTTKAGTTSLHTKLFAGDSHGGRGVGIGTAGTLISGIANSRATLDVEGCVRIQSYTNQIGVATFHSDVDLIGDAAGVTTCTWDASARSLIFNDDSKAIFGTGSDLTIYHDKEGHSYITNTTGDLRITDTTGLLIRSNSLDLRNGAGDNNYITCANGAAVTIFHNNSARVGTTTEGVDITGTGALRIPVGTSDYRPSSATQGDIRYNTTINTFEGHDVSTWGGLGGGTEIDNVVVTTSATGIGTFVKTDYRSASVRVQITQGSNYQVGRYLMIHDDTTVTVVEEAAIATNSMLGTIDGVISGSNAILRVTMGSASSATITTIIDKISV